MKRAEDDVGVIIAVDKANASSLKLSKHSQQHLKNSSDIYYVFFPRSGFNGPYYTSELLLKQSTNGI
jgi:hypothetical protein